MKDMAFTMKVERPSAHFGHRLCHVLHLQGLGPGMDRFGSVWLPLSRTSIISPPPRKPDWTFRSTALGPG